jgi:hypothetical protein
MRLTYVPALAAVTMLAACSQASKEPASEEAAPENHFGFHEAISGGAEPLTRDADTPPSTNLVAMDVAGKSGDEPGKFDAGNGTPTPSDVDVGHPPQIAYVFDYGFRLAAKAIAPLQQRHADLCESKGPYVCRIVQMDQSGTEGDYVRGTLQLAVRSDQARAFGKELTKAAEQVEGEQISATISGEDLSKQIVDTDARLRARKLLRDRLMEVLATRRGTVTELVEAERGVAQVNEEIDQASSWLSEMRGRVAFSRLDLTYESGQPSSGGFFAPIREAVGSVAGILGGLVAILIVLLAVGVPLVVLGLLVRLGWVKAGMSVPGLRRRREVDEPAA